MVPSIVLSIIAFCFAVLRFSNFTSSPSALRPLFGSLTEPHVLSSSRNSSNVPSKVRWNCSVSFHALKVVGVSLDVRTLSFGANPGILDVYYHYCISDFVGSFEQAAPRNKLLDSYLGFLVEGILIQSCV